MSSKPSFPKFTLPGDALEWMRASDVESCEPVADSSLETPPCVSLARKSNPEEKLFRVWAVWMADGLHYYVVVTPGAAMHLALRKKSVRMAKMSATAALAAPLALRFYRQKDPVLPVDEPAWMKKAHAQILKALEKHGAEALTGMGPVFLETTRQCLCLIDRAMGRDVDEAIARVRKDFLFLHDHFEEEDVVRLWREALVDKTHDR